MFTGFLMIRNYKSGDLKSGFIGVRVAVSVGGKVKQKWYSNSQYAQPTAMLLATKQEAKWHKMQLDHDRNAIKSKRSNTGIKCLYFTYEEKRTNSGKRYRYPIITFQYMRSSKITSAVWRVDKTLNIPKSLWEDICLFIKNTRTLKAKTYEALRGSMPDSEKYFLANS